MSNSAGDMTASTSLASGLPVVVSRSDFGVMLEFSRTVFRLKDNPGYLRALATSLPAAARVRTRWPSVLMGFDFHLTPDGPKLIEINNNAGGLYIGRGLWLPQPVLPEMPGSLQRRLLEMFPGRWRRIAILDEDIERQFMYPEMRAYAELLRSRGRDVCLCSPEDIEWREGRGLYVDGARLDAIYNRHTDFYLESEAMAHLRRAYEAGLVELNPHPRSYALIGDKTRMVDWWRPGLLEDCVDEQTRGLIRKVTPESRRMSGFDEEELWQQRRRWVFKPAARHGGKGVVLGKAMSRKRFAELDRADTIVQQLVPASEVEIDGRMMKLDIRLFMHGENLIAVAGRVWRGQVTNFRQPGSGWVALAID